MVAHRNKVAPEPPPVAPYKKVEWEFSSPLKGETEAQRLHANEILKRAEDTSIDGPWDVAPSWTSTDYYTIAVMVPCLLPQILIIFPLLFVLLLLPVALNICYVSTAGGPAKTLERLPRNSCGWLVHCTAQWLLSIPAQLIVLLSLTISLGAMTIFGLLHCTLTCGWSRYCRNLEVIAPYTGGPSLYWLFADCVAAAGGMAYRQGLVEFTKSFALMFILNPWVKYWITGNVYIVELGERYITQIGRRMDDMPLEQVDDNFRKCISRARNTDANRQTIDAAFFCPHYPYPPDGRRFAIGMQHAGKITTFVHPTHFRSPEVANEGPISALSTSVELPIYRVMLWRNNPYHIYTGFVEASITNGEPSQTDKMRGAEHPMWLVSSHNKLAADRKLKFSIGWIDVFFDAFIPVFQRFIRQNVLGEDAAEAAFAADPQEGFETERERARAATES